MYVPAAVPAATLTAPVAGSRDTLTLDVETCDRITFAVIAAAPARVSLPSTLTTAVPPPAGTEPASSTASIAPALTVIETTAVSQLAGALASQIR